MTDEAGKAELPRARVATRPGASGVAEHRRGLYQRHVLLFLVVNGPLIAADLLTSPGLQWAYFLSFPWFLIFLLHTVGLASRGYSLGELLIPPRRKPLAEVYTTPLDYELVRSRQLRDGVVSAAAALPEAAGSELADRAVQAADDVVGALETLVAEVRSGDGGEPSQAMLSEAREALAALDQLHQDLIRLEVLDVEPDDGSVKDVEERAAALRQLTG